MLPIVAPELLGARGHGPVHPSLVGAGVQCGPVNGADACRMFNIAFMVRAPATSQQRSRSGVRGTPLDGEPVERLVGTMRREFLDHLLFWNARDLERNLPTSRPTRTRHAATRRWRPHAIEPGFRAAAWKYRVECVPRAADAGSQDDLQGPAGSECRADCVATRDRRRCRLRGAKPTCVARDTAFDAGVLRPTATAGVECCARLAAGTRVSPSIR